MVERIKEFFRSPQGKRAVGRARTMGRDPRNQQRVRQFMDRWRHRNTH
ncbi:hypothetical protein N5079_04170 [Planotetraspora sp. A-T 1434]|nr:hypothetical protein [Planotetraspora sp. A-T 1434]MCT9929410.1 hypothetical protein [Planotetraspora sp. A-T 1434]